MNTRALEWRGCAVTVLTASLAGCVSPKPVEERFPVEAYSRQRSETIQDLSEAGTVWVSRLRTGSEEEQRQAMKGAAVFAREHIAPHAQQVEALYMAADRLAGARYTETMRYQHREIEVQVHFLEKLAADPEPDVAMFRSKMSSLLHYMWAHMDTETNTIAALVVDHELEARRALARTAR